ncbi:hypothetical protein [Nocardia grenadensis]
MRTIVLQTELPTAAGRVWDAVLSPATFLYVCRGLFGVPALAGRVERFRAGECGTAWLWAFHIVPAYRHTIEVVDVDDAAMTIRTHEHGGIISTWNHTLQVCAIDADRCRYSDTIEVDAGPMTFLLVPVVAGIFRYRLRRWRKLVDRHLLPGGPVYARRKSSPR